MIWPSLATYKTALPDHCEPTNDFLLHFSSTFHTCIPTPLAFTSNLLGTISILAWLCAQLPQIWKNYRYSSTSGLSIFFLVEWCLGDISNLLGALFTHQASWQVAIGGYYVFVDLCLVAQWLWYEKLRHGNMVRRVFGEPRDGLGPTGGTDGMYIEGMPISQTPSTEREEDSSTKAKHSRPQIIFRSPTFERKKADEEKASPNPSGTTIHRVGASSSPMASPSPRTILLIACLIAITQATPTPLPSPPLFLHNATTTSPSRTRLELTGTILSWTSTFLYLGSRLPQLLKNFHRKSTAGLSPHLFLAAFLGNLFYSSALLTNPCAWEDLGPYGSGGWVGAKGSDRGHWVAAALPFFLGAAGVLGLDASVGVQFMMYGEGGEKVVVLEEDRWHRRHWRKVSGWMRGWVPSISEGVRTEESEGLLGREAGHEGEGYGALQ
ncbi:PQ-loop-domain-containing protein [Teratosphaeria nubilosa]|uniref:PQ-loop-domain-containing protein n=1 Tax=Teratosphaeria nubilosa TaxID=161662 RepID=A0A6G1L467_9PEZI|nr:PQ-loop-domain-containing protein [Teratosphaeria nubilosa]